MNKDKLIEFAKEQCEIFPEDSYMGKYLRETIKILQAEPCEDAISREDVIKAVDRHTFDADSGLCLDEDISIILEDLSPVKPVAKAKMEKHTDRQIYDGCINLIQKMVDYFQEYLDYLGYDLDKLDEDERFAVGMSNMKIVRQLFLQHTRNSGGCSTRDFCEKLGIDPYRSVKFEFDWYEEE